MDSSTDSTAAERIAFLESRIKRLESTTASRIKQLENRVALHNDDTHKRSVTMDKRSVTLGLSECDDLDISDCEDLDDIEEESKQPKVDDTPIFTKLM